MSNNLFTWSIVIIVLTINFVIITEELNNDTRMIINEIQTRSPLLVLLIDGLRWDVVDSIEKTLNNDKLVFERLRTGGIYKDRIRPVFPAECHPNMFSLFTGVHPVEHGVLFSTTPNLSSNMSKVDTLWQTAAKNNKTVHMFHLPICSESEANQNTWLCEPYDKNQMRPDKLNQTIGIALKELISGKTDIAIVYYDELDQIGHEYGPLSSRLISQAWPELNTVLNHMLDYVARYIPESNIIITSDHGMTDFKGTEFLERFFKGLEIDKVINRGSTVWLWPHSTVSPSLMYHKLLSQQTGSKFRVYNSTNLPSNWYTGGQDFPPILMVAEPGYIFFSENWPHISLNNVSYKSVTLSGVHGYDPDFIDMHFPLFIYGPNVDHRIGALFSLIHSDVSIVEIHNIMLRLTGLSNSQPTVLDKSILLEQSNQSQAYSTILALAFHNNHFIDDWFVCFTYFIVSFVCLLILLLVVILLHYCCGCHYRYDYYCCSMLKDSDVLNKQLIDPDQNIDELNQTLI